jgi:predicted N-acetyltransferase YhbS
VALYTEGGDFPHTTIESLEDCYTVILMENQIIIGAITFAAVEVEGSELVLYIMNFKIARDQRKKGTGTKLFGIVRDMAARLRDSDDYLKVFLLLGACNERAPHAFYENIGCTFV